MTGLVMTPGWLHIADDHGAGTRPMEDEPTDLLSGILDVASEYAGRAHQQVTLILSLPGARRRFARQANGPFFGDWKMGGTTLQPWTTFRKDRHPTVHLGLLDEIREDPTKAPRKRRNPLFHGHEDPEHIAARLHWYQQAVGAPYFMTPGVSGCESIRMRWDRKGAAYRFRRITDQPYWGMGTRARIADPCTMAGDLSWERHLTRSELSAQWVHSYDLRAARLSAANVADLPWNPLTEVDDAVFDERVAGYWQIPGDHLLRGDPWSPPLMPMHLREAPEVWLTTPIVKDMMRRGYNPPITAARVSLDTGPRTVERGTRRWLYKWACDLDRVRLDALRQGPESAAHQSIQRTYKEAVGMMMREGGSIFLPLVSHTIIDQQRVNLITKERRVYQETNTKAFRAATDALWWASDAPTPFPVTLGDRLGMWRVQYIVPMSVWLEGGHSAAQQYWAERKEGISV